MAPWWPSALISLGFWGVWGVLAKVATRELGPKGAYLLGVLGYVPVLGLVLLETGGRVAWHPWGWGAALGAGVSTGLGLYFFFRALHDGSASVIVPLTSLYPLVTVLLSWLVLRESLTLKQLGGLFLALTAVWLLSE